MEFKTIIGTKQDQSSEIAELKQALKDKNIITDADLLNAKEKIKSDKQKANWKRNSFWKKYGRDKMEFNK